MRDHNLQRITVEPRRRRLAAACIIQKDEGTVGEPGCHGAPAGRMAGTVPAISASQTLGSSGRSVTV
jgi:hypothetical protein